MTLKKKDPLKKIKLERQLPYDLTFIWNPRKQKAMNS